MRATQKNDEECERLVVLGEALWSLAMSATPRAAAYRAEMETPLVGELVLVRHCRGSSLPRDRVGILQDASLLVDSAHGNYRRPLQSSATKWTILTLRGVLRTWNNVHVIQIERMP